MEVFLVYLWLKLDSFRWIAGLATVLCPIFLAAIWFWILSDADGLFCADKENIKESADRTKRARRNTTIVLFTALFTSLVVPDAKQVAVLIGTHYAVQLAGSPEGQKVTSLIRKKANEYLDEQLKEVKK